MVELSQGLCKAARGLLEWSIKDLAEASGLSLDTLRSFESGRTKRLSAGNQSTAIKAFEANGVEFIERKQVANGSGVVLKAGGSDE